MQEHGNTTVRYRYPGAPSVGWGLSDIGDAISSAGSVVSNVVDRGSSFARGAVTDVFRPVADVGSAIVHPLADVVEEVPVVGVLGKAAKAALSVGNTATGILSKASAIQSDVLSTALGLPTALTRSVFGDNSTSDVGTVNADPKNPFHSDGCFVKELQPSVYPNAITWFYLGIVGEKNVFVPSDHVRPYVKAGKTPDDFVLSYPTYVPGNDDWKKSALLFSSEDLLKAVGNALTTKAGSVWRVYAHSKVGSGSAYAKSAVGKMVPSTNVVITRLSVYSNPNYEDLKNEIEESASKSVANTASQSAIAGAASAGTKQAAYAANAASAASTSAANAAAAAGAARAKWEAEQSASKTPLTVMNTPQSLPSGVVVKTETPTANVTESSASNKMLYIGAGVLALAAFAYFAGKDRK